MSIILPKTCEIILEKLNDAGHEAYIVGGCVRDSLLGLTPKDWDICTSALPEEMMMVFSGYRIIPTGLAHGTLTVLIDGEPIEVTTYRIDGEYEDHRRPKDVIYTKSLMEDLARRDFTINSMAWHPLEGLIDCFNGREDLENRIVRAVGDPRTRFYEDGLRIMRMVRFATILDFDYDLATAIAAKEGAYLLQHISKERLQAELNKVLLSSNVARGMWDIENLGLLSYVLPLLCHSVGFRQENGRHFLDVYEHACLAVALIEPDLVLRLAMLLHDIGKPYTWEISEAGTDEFPNHQLVGGSLANEILKDLRYDNDTRKEVVKLIVHHTDRLENDRVALRKKMSELGIESVKHLLSVKVADILAHHVVHQREEVHASFEAMLSTVNAIIEDGDPIFVKDLDINGVDMMDLGYQRQEVGKKLQEALDLVLEDPSKNNREFLLKYLSPNK